MARSFPKAGMEIAIADVEAPALESAVAALREITPDALALSVDVADRKRVAQAAEETVLHFGKVHVLGNNAGVSVTGPIERLQDAD